ncbi:MAG: SOS response-associated peptidase [Kiritimatiellae bacterium]|nr:SOS response-associated peptidase [Kiritimatiellia bacterium]
MCGRYSLVLRKEEIASVLGIDGGAVEVELPHRYNIAPGQLAPVAVSVDKRRRLISARWGIPGRRSVAGQPLLINVRAESVIEGRPVGLWLSERRCAIPASGFYEWCDRGGVRTPYYFSRRDGRPMLFAGFWSPTTSGEEVGFVIATTCPNELVGRIHNRMPAILREERLGEWLEGEGGALVQSVDWCEPFPADLLRCWEVSRRVNNPRYDDATCIQPVGY